MHRSDRLFALLAAAGVGFWAVYALFAPDAFPFAFYLTVLAGAAAVAWRVRRLVASALEWRGAVSFFVIAYGMVLAEEVVAAFAHAFAEGFTLPLFLLRLLQFWTLNILAFTALIIGWYALRRFSRWTLRESLYLTGVYGVLSEGLYRFALSDTLGFMLAVPPIMLVYGFIMAPALLTAPPPAALRPRGARYAAAAAVFSLLSIIASAAISIVRTHAPDALPPATLVR